MTPTQRSLALLRKEGWTVGIVERWIAQARKRIDLFGFGDLLAVRGAETMLVQTTSAPNLAAHITKAQALPEYQAWLDAGRQVEFHGWSKRGARGKRKLWSCRRIQYWADKDSAGHMTDDIVTKVAT